MAAERVYNCPHLYLRCPVTGREHRVVGKSRCGAAKNWREMGKEKEDLALSLTSYQKIMKFVSTNTQVSKDGWVKGNLRYNLVQIGV